MTKRRYVLIGIPATCILAIIVSLVISPNRTDVEKKEKEIPSRRSLSLQGQAKAISDSDTVTQTVEGLSIPNYNERGKEVFTMRGENTFLLDNDVYKILSPEITVLDPVKSGNGTQTVVITSGSGVMDKSANEGTLSEKVVISFGQEIQLNSESLRYLPEENAVSTDGAVTITGNGMKITGQGCVIDIIHKKMWIEKEVEMVMDGVKNDLFFLSRKSASEISQAAENTDDVRESGKNERQIEKSFIRSAGQLIFDVQRGVKVLTFNDNVEFKKGDSSVFSDTLIIFLDAETKRTKQAIASGNVLASQGTTIAKGNSLTWDVNTQSGTLEDTHKAEFIKDGLRIDARKMIFFKDAGRIDVPSAGSLKVKIKAKKAGKDPVAGGEEEDTNISVTWEGKMYFQDDKREAHFEKDIEIKRDRSVLFCDNLKVTFNENDYNLHTLKAAGKVRITDKKDSLVSEAVGDLVAWNVKNEVTVLRGEPFALLREGDRRKIISPRVLFYKNEKKIVCEGRGSLYEKGFKMASHDDASEIDIKVDWKKKMMYSDMLKKASFYEEVQVEQGGQKLNADQIDTYLDQEQKMRNIIATGNVFFLSEELGNCEGIGTLFTWDLIKEIALLTGDPNAEIRREGSRTFSKKVYFDMGQKRVTWEGRPHWQLIGKE